MREQMLASVSGAHLAEIRKQLGMTQLAEAAGLSQADQSGGYSVTRA
jgi:transcriptional regulator with XRE-family HTH domain